ncbi:hypothetical protein [uncultured Paludibaculum sp.]|uniref:hypothetical protein n=1 Tax=uncultured Paludibaculum sp. TaxID=1765020 RepID=UPI002AAB5566|nr:hypothetical protein [uncultured Paludibaculum sp.]
MQSLEIPREPWIQPGRREGVNWDGVFKQSALFLGLEHGFRLMTERGTREGMKGPFFSGWLAASGNLHGWADGDPFYVNYIGHPMQGAVAGYIWVQNDGKYGDAEFGANRHYWKSRLRASAFSAAYSFQFEAGPLSEASIGKVQSRWPQQGLVDHVITPVVGAGWMIAEDALDRYVIKRMETSWDNPYALVFVRGVLNPSRSLANMLRFKVPWARDDRPGLWSPFRTAYLREQRGAVIQGYPDLPPEIEGEAGVSSFELSLNAQPQFFLGSGGTGPCVGGGGEAAFRITPNWQLVTQVNGCKLTGLKENLSGDTLSFYAGPRWNPRPTARWSPYFHVLLGGMKVSQEEMFPALKAAVEKAAKESDEPEVALHDLYTTQYEANGFSMAAGGGVDLRVNPAIALRLANLEYKRSWLPPANGRDYNNGLAFTVSMVLRMGTW